MFDSQPDFFSLVIAIAALIFARCSSLGCQGLAAFDARILAFVSSGLGPVLV